MSKRRVKIYTYHNTYSVAEKASGRLLGISQRLLLPFRLLARMCYAVGFFLVRTALSIVSILGSLCYLFGLALLWPFTLLGKGRHALARFTEQEIEATTASLQAKWQRLGRREFKVSMATFFVLCLVSASIFPLAQVYVQGQQFKGRVLGDATAALRELESGLRAAREDTALAQGAFAQALNGFSKSREDLRELGGTLNSLLSVLPAKQDAEALLEAGVLLSEAALAFTEVYNLATELTFSASGVNGQQGLPQLLPALLSNLTTAATKLEQAHSRLGTVGAGTLPADYQGMLADAQEKLHTANRGLAVLIDVVDLGNRLLLGEKTVLVLFQNNNELRPGGGFIGTFGEFTLMDGSIRGLHISSIYDLDGQLREKIIPPFPLFAVNNRLFLRDANWFASFTDTAKLTGELYQKTRGANPDLVIALTPELVVRLLRITGPIHLPAYNVTLDADNFVEQTQIETSIEYDKEENKPKQMLADFVPVFLEALSQLSSEQSAQVLNALQESLLGKDALFYAADPALQNQLQELGWTGTVAEANRDYMYVVKANLGGTKTDRYIKDALSIESRIEQNGSIVNTVTFTRTNTLPLGQAMVNTSFIRFLVPLGSALETANGFTKTTLDTGEASGESHPLVDTWEQGAVEHRASGTVVGQEAGKTFFGNWLTVAGGETKTIELTYRLPFTLAQLDRMSLSLQKQPGSLPMPVTYTVLSTGRKSLYATGIREQVPGELQAEASLDRDMFFGAVLEKN